MVVSQNVEEFEINFAAFINSARNVTFVLQKEFRGDEQFEVWYSKKKLEMRRDELCSYFYKLRSLIVKEGINGIQFVTEIQSLNTSTDFKEAPPNSDIIITARGIFHLVHKGTGQEDWVTAKTTASFRTGMTLANAPATHLGVGIRDKDITEISALYFEYLKNLVEEFTAIKNTG